MNDFKTRWRNHVNSQKCPALNAAIKKYGKEKFTMIEIDSAESLEEALKKETSYIKELNSLAKNGMGYNLTEFTEACLYDDEIKNKMIKTRMDRKRIKPNSRSSKFFGVYFNQKYKMWEYSFNRDGVSYIGNRYESEKDTATARDIRISKILDEKDCLAVMNFPENYHKYISGEIKMPSRILTVEFCNTIFNFVYFYKRDKAWHTRILGPDGRTSLASRGCFEKEEDAAETADFLNLKYINDHSKLNFPEKLEEYLSPDYSPPLTKHEKNVSSPYANISYSGVGNNFYYRLAISAKGVRYYPVFKNLKEAIAARNAFIQQHNLKSPVDRPEFIRLKNLDPKIWTLED